MKKIYVLMLALLCIVMTECVKDDEPLSFEPKIQISKIGTMFVQIEASCPNSGFDKLTAYVSYSENQDMTDAEQKEMEYKDAKFHIILDGLQKGITYYYKINFIGKYSSVETAVDSFETIIGEGEINGHAWVDLGLPSGNRWASCNIGASSPDQNGNYFAWGETTAKETFDSNNSETQGQDISDFSGVVKYDAARAQWGDYWRIPKKAECQELVDNCTWNWVEVGTVKGYNVIGPNGNSIFIPAAGSCSNIYAPQECGKLGGYWTSTPYNNTSNNGAYVLRFYDESVSVDDVNRYLGRTIRPVISNNN